MPDLSSECRDGILTLTIDRPARANAFDQGLIAGLLEAFDAAARDEDVRCLVLTGAGAVFSAGQDVTEMRAVAGKVSYREHLQRTYNPLILAVRRLEKPVVASINGPCAGAALGLALACDLRLAAESARFVVGFAGLGLAPDSGVSYLLPKVVGLGRAAQATLTNAPIPAEQALEWGLVAKVVPDAMLAAETASMAGTLAAGPTGAFGLAKRAFNAAALPDLESALDAEADLQEQAGMTREHLDAVRAFLEGRPWRGV